MKATLKGKDFIHSLLSQTDCCVMLMLLAGNDTTAGKQVLCNELSGVWETNSQCVYEG